MSRILSTFAVLAVVAGFASLSFGAADHEKDFKKLDADGDGKLTLAEATAGKTGDQKTKAEEKFKKCDADSDGSVTLDEYKKSQDEKKGEKKEEKKNEKK